MNKIKHILKDSNYKLSLFDEEALEHLENRIYTKGKRADSRDFIDSTDRHALQANAHNEDNTQILAQHTSSLQGDLSPKKSINKNMDSAVSFVSVDSADYVDFGNVAAPAHSKDSIAAMDSIASNNPIISMGGGDR